MGATLGGRGVGENFRGVRKRDKRASDANCAPGSASSGSSGSESAIKNAINRQASTSPRCGSRQNPANKRGTVGQGLLARYDVAKTGTVAPAKNKGGRVPPLF